MTKGQQYAKDIVSGKINHGKWIKILCEQHFSDLKAGVWKFDLEQANKYIDFIELLSLTKGEWAGKPFILEPWQAFIVEMIYGWVDPETGFRRYTEVTINVSKKNGKTEFAAALSLATPFIDQEHGGQIYMAATSRDQAALCFQTAKDMLKWHPEIFGQEFQTLAHAIWMPGLGASIKAISSDASTAEGKGASLVIFDEEHEQKTTQLRDNLRSGMAARRQPLFISISTSGSDKNKPYYKHIDNCKKMLNKLTHNDRHLAFIYCAPEDIKDGWRDEATWKISNPNYGVSVKPEFLRSQFIEALNEPAKQPNFITKHLNIWADSAKTWIDSQKWASLGQKLNIEDFYGKTAYIGLDLGSTGDFSAMSILIPNDSRDRFHLFMRFYIPEKMADKRTRADQINFQQWWREGFIKLTDGDATDYNVIKDDLVEICSNFQYKPISYDKALASMFMVQLYNEHQIQVESFSQSVGNVTGPTKQFYEWIMNGSLIHNNNPVMAWMISNVEVYQDDANGNYKIHKGKSKNKVDGPCAVVNAIGRMLKDFEENPIILNYVW